MSTVSMKNLSEYSLLNEFRINGKFHDVVIKVNDRSFPCHRNILAATMNYFKNMFCGEFVEAELQEIELKCIDTTDFELLLTYIYGGSVPINEVNAFRLLKIAHYFGSQSLEDSCADFIFKNSSLFSSDSIVSICEYANQTGNSRLFNGLTKWMAENFVQLSKCEKLYHISGQNLQNIFNHRYLQKDTTALLDFLTNWVKFHGEEERKLLPEFLNVIGLQAEPIKEWTLKTLLSTAVQPNSLILKLDNEDIELLDENRSEIQLPFSLVTYDKDGRNNSHVVNIYKFQSGNEKLQFVKPCLENYSKYEVFDCKSVFLNQAQFTLLSFFENQKVMGYDRRCQKLELHVRTPTKASVLVNALDGQNFKKELFAYEADANILTATVNDTNIYIHRNEEFIIYNCDRNNWFKISSDSYQKVFAPNLLSLGNSLYLVGGKYFDSSCPISCIKWENIPVQPNNITEIDGKLLQRYDGRQRKWSQLPKMKYARNEAASCVYNDIIYVSGGGNLSYYNNCNVEFYDIRAGKWGEVLTPMPRAKRRHCVTAYDDKLWFFGGEEDNSNTVDSKWFSYSLKKHTWSNIFSFPTLYSTTRIKRILDVAIEV